MLLFFLPEERLDLYAFLYLVPAGLSISLICFVIGEGFKSDYFMAILLIVIAGTGFCGRWGGEEFLILFPDTDSEGARLGVERVRRDVETASIHISSGVLKVTMTFGLARSEQDGKIDSLVRLADEALYLGKHGTKNCGRVSVRKDQGVESVVGII